MPKGVELLIAHCAGLEDRLPARDRLEELLGEELMVFLLAALCLAQPRGGRLISSSPYSLT